VRDLKDFMKTIIHINRFTIDRNRKLGLTDKPIIVRTYKGTQHADHVEILGPAKIVYSQTPLSGCGARVWIETEGQVNIIGG
jgi:hypothetical protein